MQDWLEEISQVSDHCIDLFVEDAYVVTKQRRVYQSSGVFDSPINAIRDKFAQCAQNNCSNGRLRYHYTDMRQLLIDDVSLESPIAQIALDSTNFHLPHVYDASEYKQLLRYAIGLDMSDETRIRYEAYMDSVAAANHVMLKYPWPRYRRMRKIIVDHIMKEAIKIDHTYIKNVNEFMESICDATISATQEDYYRKGSQTYDGLLTIELDAYLLLRLFVTFDQHKLIRGPIGCRQSANTKINHAIIYTGAAHIEVYLKCIKQYFNVTPHFSARKRLSSQGCIIMPRPFDFMTD